MIGPGILAAEQPGFLRLPLDKEQQLISSEPLDACYHVDEEPFARSVCVPPYPPAPSLAARDETLFTF